MNTIDPKSNDVQSRILATRAGLTGAAGASRQLGETAAVKGKSFGDILKAQAAPETAETSGVRMAGDVKFSAHAESRLKSRGIEMTPEVMGKLEKAVEGAQTKGSRDSLILVKNLAFIVNIPNKTVITAMDGESIKDNVFTNIDSTVIAS